MIIEQSQISISLPRIQNLRRKAFDLEKSLGDILPIPFELLPVPDEAPDEIPRITASSRSGHTRLVISQGNISAFTHYDREYGQSWDKCYEYLEQRVKPLYGCVDVLGTFAFYCGVIIKLQFPIEVGHAVSHLSNNFFQGFSNNPFDLTFKVTFTEEDKYYINYSFGNTRVYQVEGTQQSVALTPAELQQTGETIEVTVDVNDRYAYNYHKGYKSSLDSCMNVFTKVDKIIRTRIEQIVQEGRWL